MSKFIRNFGDGPILVHLPHNSVYIPDIFEYQRSEQELARDIHLLVDHYTDHLFEPLYGTSFVNPFCRLFFDPERYSDPSKEIMNEIGMGVFYTHTVDGNRFRADDSIIEYRSKLDTFYHPYHQQLTKCCMEMMDKYGCCILIDGHSYSKISTPCEQYQNDMRPEIDIGTDNFHTPALFQDLLYDVFSSSGYSVAFDQPFKGTLVPMSLMGDPRLYACMIDVRRDVYLDQSAYENGLVQVDKNKMKRFHETLVVLRQKLRVHFDWK